MTRFIMRMAIALAAMLLFIGAANAECWEDCADHAEMPVTPQPPQTYGYVSTQKIDMDYQMQEMQHAIDEQQAAQREQLQQNIINVEGNY